MKGLRGCHYLIRVGCKRGPMDVHLYIHQRFCSLPKNHEENHHVEIRCEGVHKVLEGGLEVEDTRIADMER